MEFRDRKASNPGRVRLTPVSGESNVYDVTLEDGAGTTNAGTPLNAQTFEEFRQDIFNYISAKSGMQGPKGDKGDKGVSISNKTFLVGSDSISGSGWYKLGSVVFSSDMDYHAKILITNTYHGIAMPSGVIDFKVRRENAAWKKHDVAWETLKVENPNYICYYLSSSGELILYAFIPQQYDFYRIDVISESNRNVYTNLFQPVVNYGSVWQTRYSSSQPNYTCFPLKKDEGIKFYEWIYPYECASDKVVSCTKSIHGINTVKGAIVVPRALATSISDLSYYSNITTGTNRYGVTISGTTVYVAFDDGTFVHGFYCLIYGV